VKSDPLAGLRDIHMPEPVSWWPPAPGWWLLLVVALLTVAGLIWWLHHRKLQQGKPKQFSQHEMIDQALTELDGLEYSASGECDARVLVADLSALLRRVAMRLKQDDASIAGLSGDDWLNWLDEQWDKDAFSHGAGRPLLDAPYQRESQIDIGALLKIARQWLQAQR